LGAEIVSDNLQNIEMSDPHADRPSQLDDRELRRSQQLEFLLTVLQSIKDSKGNPVIIHSLLQQHLDLLDAEIVDVLRNWATYKFAEVDKDRQNFIAAHLGTLSSLIGQFSLGNKNVNIELSIECCTLALKIFNSNEDLKNWSVTQNNLAIAYRNRIKGDRAENLERSIECSKSALTVCTKADFPFDWATTQNNLATAYQNRIRGDEAENLELSIKCNESALTVYTKADFPFNWAMTQNNLATSYADRIRGNRAENLEKSIDFYEAALEVISKEGLSTQWTMIQHNLAAAYQSRIRGNRAENLEKSIDCYQAALAVRTKNNFPVDWAMTQGNLAITYWYRIRGDRAKNLERSIECYRAALEIYTAELFPREWARIQVSLAQFSIATLQNYQVATEHLQFAYEQLLANNNDTGLLSETMFELARCFHKTGCLGQAKIYFKDSIRLYQRLEQPTQVAAAISALGNLELQMGAIDDARIHLQTALEFYQAAGNPDRVASIQELQQCLPEHSPEPAL
jgi:tetratricopeptide (TPR) repeat protein